MTNSFNLPRTLLTMLLAWAAAVVGEQALAQSNCVNGPPLNAAAAVADVTDLSVDACAISSDPANCSNPGNEPHRVVWNQVLSTSGDLEDELVVVFPGAGQDPRRTPVFVQYPCPIHMQRPSGSRR